MRFEIGQTVWRATFEAQETTVECPDCHGTARLRVMFADDSIVSIPCTNCARGFYDPTGRVTVYDRTANATRDTITGVSISEGKCEWRTAQSYICQDDDVFATEEEALARAAVKAAEYDAEERAKVFRKEKDTRTWSWNASYHRREIKECQRRIEHHTAKLNAANLRARKDKAAANPSNDCRTPENTEGK